MSCPDFSMEIWLWIRPLNYPILTTLYVVSHIRGSVNIPKLAFFKGLNDPPLKCSNTLLNTKYQHKSWKLSLFIMDGWKKQRFQMDRVGNQCAKFSQIRVIKNTGRLTDPGRNLKACGYLWLKTKTCQLISTKTTVSRQKYNSCIFSPKENKRRWRTLHTHFRPGYLFKATQFLSLIFASSWNRLVAMVTFTLSQDFHPIPTESEGSRRQIVS
jgi:hypothetical protein